MMNFIVSYIFLFKVLAYITKIMIVLSYLLAFLLPFIAPVKTFSLLISSPLTCFYSFSFNCYSATITVFSSIWHPAFTPITRTIQSHYITSFNELNNLIFLQNKKNRLIKVSSFSYNILKGGFNNK